MAISAGSGKGGHQGHGAMFTEINITPLTDIFLVLLVMMMVIAPGFTSSQQEIEVPQVEAGTNLKSAKFTIEVVKEGKFFIDGTEIQADALESTLAEKLPELEEKMVVVRADESTPSEVVMKVFEAASAAGFEKLTIAGQPLSTERSKELSSGETEPIEVQEGQ